MDETKQLNQIKDFARTDGGVLGILWVIGFASLLANFRYPLFGFLFFSIIIGTPFMIGFRLSYLRKKYLETPFSFFRGFTYAFLTAFYAALILAMAQWIYFSWLDNGFMLEQYRQIFDNPEYKEVMEAAGMTARELKDAVRQLESIRAIDISLQILYSNIIMSLLISMPIALLNRRS